MELWCASDLVDETWGIAYIRKFTAKQRVARRYNSNMVPRELQEGDIVLRQAVALT